MDQRSDTGSGCLTLSRSTPVVQVGAATTLLDAGVPGEAQAWGTHASWRAEGRIAP